MFDKTHASLAGHFIPGLIGLVLALALEPLMRMVGLPSGLALLGSLVGTVVFYPCALTIAARQVTGKPSLLGAVPYRKPVTIWQTLVFIPLLIGWTLLAAGLLAPFDLAIKQTFFGWVPDWFSLDFSGLRSGIRTVALTIYLLFGTLAGPVVQELYFRGMLLPRLARFKWAGPLVNTILFSATHFYEPWSWISLTVAFLPVAFLVNRKQNVYLSILYHCLLNLFSAAVIFGLIPKPG